jgi:hypothetical protein
MRRNESAPCGLKRDGRKALKRLEGLTMFGIGTLELIIILGIIGVVALVIFASQARKK